MAQISWNFENGNDHGFRLWCVNPATPAANDPNTAGDEAITGVGGSNGLPGAGIAWTIGPPNQFDGQAPAVDEIRNCHDDVGGILQYSECNDPFGVFDVTPPSYVNNRGQSSYLNTYNLNQWGDSLHTVDNDQIATSPPVLLFEGAELSVWSHGGGSMYYRYRFDEPGTIAPEAETDRKKGYKDLSCGIAVLSAQDSSLLASMTAQNLYKLLENKLDLSQYAGQTVIIEVVDAIDWDWGWIAVDEIQITNATLAPVDLASKPNASPMTYALMQNYPNPFNPNTNIQFQIPKAGHVTISVCNSLGQQVATLVDENLNSGIHNVAFEAAAFPSGIYYYRIQAEGFSQAKKMLLLK
jgi:hypothetical protein